MNKKDAIRDLELQYRQLLFSVRLPDAVLDPAAPPFVKDLDLAFTRELIGDAQPWGGEDVFAESERLLRAVIGGSPEGRKLFLASEIDLLRSAKEPGKDFVHEGPFGILEGIFPLAIRGHVAHLIRTGKYIVSPFSDEDLKEIAFLAGRNIKEVQEAAAALPVLTVEQVDQISTLHRRLRDALATALEQRLKVAELVRQQWDVERMQSLGAMAKGMAHHLNNLLTTILGYASLVADKGDLRGDMADAAKRVSESAQRGRRFTEEILTIAGEDEEEEDVPTPVHDRINGVLTLLQDRVEGKAAIQTRLLAKRDAVVGPPGLVHQILFNLITQAIDGLPLGGAIEISSYNGRDETDGRDLIHLEIVGRGAAPESDQGRASARMASVFGLVGRLDGTLNVSAAEDGSARVLVTLPAEERTTARPEKKMKRRLAPSRIWVADDDSVVREMCRRVLSEDGHTVEEAGSGKDARAMFERKDGPKPDLIVYDFNMPDYSGLEFCSRLRDDGIRVPVLLLSGFKPDQSSISDALKLRKTFFLQKPFSFRDMSDMVTVALGETLIEE